MTSITGNHLFRRSTCGWGDRAAAFLDDNDVDYEDHVFSSKAEEESFKQQHEVSTTPQVFLQGKRIGGYEDLARHYQ